MYIRMKNKFLVMAGFGLLPLTGCNFSNDNGETTFPFLESKTDRAEKTYVTLRQTEDGRYICDSSDENVVCRIPNEDQDNAPDATKQSPLTFVTVNVTEGGELICNSPHEGVVCNVPDEAQQRFAKKYLDIPTKNQNRYIPVPEEYRDISSDYEHDVYYRDEDEVRKHEEYFKEQGLSAEARQAIRNQALFYSAEVHVTENIFIAIQYGANMYAKNEDGQTLREILIEEEGESRAFAIFLELYKRYGYDIQFLANEPDLIFDYITQNINDISPEKIDDFFAVINAVTKDFSILKDTRTGISLYHFAVLNENEELLSYLQKYDKSPDPYDAKGRHALSYISPQNRAPYKKYFDAESLPSDEEYYTSADIYEAQLIASGAPIINVPTERYKRSHFDMYTPISYTSYGLPDNAISPTLLVAEHPTLNWGSAAHHKNTSHVALGVDIAITESGTNQSNSKNIIGIAESAIGYSDNHLTTLLNNNNDDYLIVSSSMGTRWGAYEYGYNYDLDDLYRMDKRNFVYYNSAGNEGLDPIVTVDGITFSSQDSGAYFHYRKMVRVGAVEYKDKDTYAHRPYSNLRPTFCAALPFAERGSHFQGTSFTAPAAAAIERNLADKFARSAAFPEGVTHDDILMALMLTAKKELLNNEKDTVEDSFFNFGKSSYAEIFTNVAGIEMTNECGAGVIQPQRAADLLNQMVKWTKENANINPTEPFVDRQRLVKANPTKQGKFYEYEATVSKNGILTSFRAGIPYKYGARGAAMIQINNQEPLILDLSSSGLTNEFRLAGQEFKAGDKIKILSTKPLSDREPAFIDLNMVQPSSPINPAIKEFAKR